MKARSGEGFKGTSGRAGRFCGPGARDRSVGKWSVESDRRVGFAVFSGMEVRALEAA